MKIEFNSEKLKKLVHYICYRCDADPSRLGKVKLNKILILSDFGAYYYYAKPITGEKYIKDQFGPVSSHLSRVTSELVNEGSIVVKDVKHFGYSKKEYIVLTKPDISGFSAEEISHINEMIDYVCDENTATSISKKMHDDIYDLAHIGEEFPYALAFVRAFKKITEDDISWAQQQIDNAA